VLKKKHSFAFLYDVFFWGAAVFSLGSADKCLCACPSAKNYEAVGAAFLRPILMPIINSKHCVSDAPHILQNKYLLIVYRNKMKNTPFWDRQFVDREATTIRQNPT
jgi:hypothetical protein